MKSLLFILLLSPAWCFSQTLSMDYDNATGTIDGTTFPKGALYYSLPGVNSIRIFIYNYGSVWGTRPYTDFTYNGGAFPSRDSLTSWLNVHMFPDTTSGGGGDTATLTSVTTGAGNNLTPNAIQITGLSNIDLSKTSTTLLEQGANGGLYRIDSTLGGVAGSIEISNTIVAINAGGVSSINIQPQTGVNASVLVSGRIDAQPGINANDVTTTSQVLLKTDFKGGQSLFTADGIQTMFNITHNLGAIPSFFTLTTTTVITLNQLNRTITFPDANTMRITFNTAPLIGEDVNYVWTVYK
mgnify:CR=1 FL=1